MQNLLLVTLGWLAGVFSSLLLEWNRATRTVKSLRKALEFELAEFRFRMAGVAFMLSARSGTLSQDQVAWLISEFKSYQGFAPTTQFLQALETMQQHPREAELVGRRFAAELQQASLGLKKYPTPALDAAVTSVALFTPHEQRYILELRTLISNLESATDESWRFFEMTFNSSLSGESRRRVDINLKVAYAQAAQLCQRIAQHIAAMTKAA